MGYSSCVVATVLLMGSRISYTYDVVHFQGIISEFGLFGHRMTGRKPAKQICGLVNLSYVCNP